MAEIIIAKHRNGAVGDVLLRFRAEFARFQNPDDDMVIPGPGDAPGVIRSKINATPPPPSATDAPNPFDGVGGNGPLPF
jgi:replicative DNA helicase